MYCSICEFVYKYSKFYKIFSNVMPHCIIEDLHFNNPITWPIMKENQQNHLFFSAREIAQKRLSRDVRGQDDFTCMFPDPEGAQRLERILLFKFFEAWLKN